MNGLKNRRLTLASASRIIYLIAAVMIGPTLFSGCSGWKWTDFEFYNKSDNKIKIEVFGINPDPSPGVMPASVDSSGSRAGLHFGDPIHIDQQIKIVWTADDASTKKEQSFKREELGIPPVVSGGTLTFTYTAEKKWEIDYAR